MRLIDADALIDKTDDRYSLGEIGRRERDDIVNALEFAPTIEPEPSELARDIATIIENEKDMRVIAEPRNGKWVRNIHDKVICNQCGMFGNNEWNFCPNCGADMRDTDD